MFYCNGSKWSSNHYGDTKFIYIYIYTRVYIYTYMALDRSAASICAVWFITGLIVKVARKSWIPKQAKRHYIASLNLSFLTLLGDPVFNRASMRQTGLMECTYICIYTHIYIYIHMDVGSRVPANIGIFPVSLVLWFFFQQQKKEPVPSMFSYSQTKTTPTSFAIVSPSPFPTKLIGNAVAYRLFRWNMHPTALNMNSRVISDPIQ